MIDALSGEVEEFSSGRIGGASQAIAIDERKNTIYVSDEENNRIDIIDGSTHAIAKTLSVDAPGAMVADERGQGLYVASKKGPLLYLIDAVSNEVAGSKETGDGLALNLVIDDDAQKIYIVTDHGDVRVSI